MRTRNWFLSFGDQRVGFETNTIYIGRKPYMDRWVVYLGVGGSCLRLHKFYRGDDDRAPHDHPWSFITFPLTSYTEVVEREVYTGFHRDRVTGEWVGGRGWLRQSQLVKALRVHRRPSEYRHFVVGRADGKTKPFWTIVFAYGKHRKWGFWPTPETFVYWKFWR